MLGVKFFLIVNIHSPSSCYNPVSFFCLTHKILCVKILCRAPAVEASWVPGSAMASRAACSTVGPGTGADREAFRPVNMSLEASRDKWKKYIPDNRKETVDSTWAFLHRSSGKRRKSSDVNSVIVLFYFYFILFFNKRFLLNGNTSDTTPGDHYFHNIFYNVYLEFCFYVIYIIYLILMNTLLCLKL